MFGRFVTTMLMSVFILFFCPVLCPAYIWTHSTTGKSQTTEPLELTGQGTGMSQWTSEEITLTPRAVYRFSVDIMSPTGDSGCLPCGTDFLHRDFSATPEWTTQSYFFRVPREHSSGVLRVGEWESTGAFCFKNIRLEQCVSFPKVFEDKRENGEKILRLLGEGESIRDGKYGYTGRFAGDGTNIASPILHASFDSLETTPLFNSNRFCFGPGNELVFTFADKVFPTSSFAPQYGTQLKKAALSVVVNYYQAGLCVLEMSYNEGETWSELGRLDKAGMISVSVPELNDEKSVKLQFRIRAEGTDVHFQIDAIDYFEADVSSSLNNAVGKTYFAIPGNSESVAEQNNSSQISNPEISNSGINNLAIGNSGISNSAIGHSEIRSSSEFFPIGLDDKRNIYFVSRGNNGSLPITKTRLRQPGQLGERPAKFRLGTQEYQLIEEMNLYYRSDYGYNIPGWPIGQIWWSEADWKIAPQRPVPDRMCAEPIRISAAKNDYESFQLVVNGGERGIQGLTATVSSLRGPDGQEIPAKDVQVRYAYYHFVHSVTDRTGVVDYWPDALVPLEMPIEVQPNRNQPIWITAYIPSDAASGLYLGTVQLTFESMLKEGHKKSHTWTIPFAVKVWNFALPVENHIKTAYGINPGMIARYHNAKTEEERRAVYELYLKNFSEHRISPYTPAPFESIGVNWKTDETPMRAELDVAAFEKEMRRVMEKYHFTGFRLDVQGMGWGTFHERGKGNLAGFEEGSPEYNLLFADYVKQLQEFLRKNNWLEKAYIYWFDEPNRKDYEFVADGFSRIHQAAPEIPKMLTEKPSDTFTQILADSGAKVDIWCPISNNYSIKEAKKREAVGEKFWWYVCTGPKAPYATLFIDHPATDLRVWFWQTWERGIIGSLVWESTYWTSDAAFPDSVAPQNPYLDPMGYVSGYSTPSGSKVNWGNGDGRFVYPPLCAAIPGGNGGEVILKEPVSSIRWEMIREGIEDYETLWILRDLLAEKGERLSPEERQKAEELLIVPDSISKSMTQFTQDARTILKRREQVADMIEILSNPVHSGNSNR